MNLIFQELWILYHFLFQLHIYKYKNEDHAKKEFINQHYIIYIADKILFRYWNHFNCYMYIYCTSKKSQKIVRYSIYILCKQWENWFTVIIKLKPSFKNGQFSIIFKWFLKQIETKQIHIIINREKYGKLLKFHTNVVYIHFFPYNFLRIHYNSFITENL